MTEPDDVPRSSAGLPAGAAPSSAGPPGATPDDAPPPEAAEPGASPGASVAIAAPGHPDGEVDTGAP